MKFDFYEIVNSSIYRKTFKMFLGKENSEIVIRPTYFLICSKNELSNFVKRIIILPSHGFTANRIDLLNPHPEARKIRIKILGKINPTKKGFKPLLREIKFRFSLTRNIPTENVSAYARFMEKYCGSQLLSWKNWFYVTKENGWGNFHNLINLSNEWVLVLLEKELANQKKLDLKPYLNMLTLSQSERLIKAIKKIERIGDKIFENQSFVLEVLKFPLKILVPILIQMLNVKETGRHEPCTFFAFLLKIARENNNLVYDEVNKAIKLELSPHYYLESLKRKLK